MKGRRPCLATAFIALTLLGHCASDGVGQFPHVLDIETVQGAVPGLHGLRLRGILMALGQVSEVLTQALANHAPEEVSAACLAAIFDGPFAANSFGIHSSGSVPFEVGKVPVDLSLLGCWWTPGSCLVVRMDYANPDDPQEVVDWISGAGSMPDVSGSVTLFLSVPTACTMQDAALHLAPQLVEFDQATNQDFLATQALVFEIKPGIFEVPRKHMNLARFAPAPGSSENFPEAAIDGFSSDCERAATSAPDATGSRFHQIFGRVLCSPSAYSHPEDFTGAAAGLKIYVQPLTSSLNADRLVVASLVRLAHNFSCDPGLFPCSDTSWEGEWSAWRQHAGEVLLLQKFLTAPPEVLVDSADQADLIVVPGLFQFASSTRLFRQAPFSCPRDMMKELEHLKFMLPEQIPHIFVFANHANNLRNTDPGGLNCYISRHPDNIFISYGNELSSPGHITMPPVMTEEALQPRASASEDVRDTFLLYAENVDCCHPVRKHFYDVLLSDLGQASCASKCIVENTTRRAPTSKAGGLDHTRAMQRAVFCPMGPGEVPHRHKLYRAIMAGCIPVLYDFPSYYPGHRSWWKEYGSPNQLSLPFYEVVPYKDFVVTVPCTENYTQSSVDMLWRMRSMGDEEIRQRQDAMRKWREVLAYRWDGDGPDAFTALMQQIGVIWKRMKKLKNQTGT